MHEGRLARARHAGDHRQRAERDARVEALDVVEGGTAELEPASAGLSALAERPLLAAREQPAGRGVGLQQPVPGALEHDPAAALSRARPQLHDPVGDAQGLGLVLDHEHRVAAVPKPHEDVQEAVDVVRVEADGGLVEHVQRLHQPAPEAAGQPDALHLAARTASGPGGPGSGSRARPSPGSGAGRRAPPGSARPRGARTSRASSSASHARSASTVRAAASAIVFPPTRTCRASCRSRAPPQAKQRTGRW